MSREKTTGGTGFLTLLLVLFIGLKLAHIIDWSWWWVFSPIWIPLIIVILLLAVLGAIEKWK